MIEGGMKYESEFINTASSLSSGATITPSLTNAVHVRQYWHRSSQGNIILSQKWKIISSVFENCTHNAVYRGVVHGRRVYHQL